MSAKYVVRNGVKVPANKAMKVAEYRMKGYSIAWIANELDLTEHEVVSLLNVGGD